MSCKRVICLGGLILWLVCFLGLSTGLAREKGALTPDTKSRGTHGVGDLVDNFTVPLTDGTTLTLYDYWGYVILINTWNTT